MEKVTQKYLKSLISGGYAVDGNKLPRSGVEFLAKRPLSKVSYSSGLYGINGGEVLDDKSGQRFVFVGRTSALFTIF